MKDFELGRWGTPVPPANTSHGSLYEFRKKKDGRTTGRFYLFDRVGLLYVGNYTASSTFSLQFDTRTQF
jgi:hypothetical protein